MIYFIKTLGLDIHDIHIEMSIFRISALPSVIQKKAESPAKVSVSHLKLESLTIQNHGNSEKLETILYRNE